VKSPGSDLNHDGAAVDRPHVAPEDTGKAPPGARAGGGSRKDRPALGSSVVSGAQLPPACHRQLHDARLKHRRDVKVLKDQSGSDLNHDGTAIHRRHVALEDTRTTKLKHQMEVKERTHHRDPLICALNQLYRGDQVHEVSGRAGKPRNSHSPDRRNGQSSSPDARSRHEPAANAIFTNMHQPKPVLGWEDVAGADVEVPHAPMLGWSAVEGQVLRSIQREREREAGRETEREREREGHTHTHTHTNTHTHTQSVSAATENINVVGVHGKTAALTAGRERGNVKIKKIGLGFSFSESMKVLLKPKHAHSKEHQSDSTADAHGSALGPKHKMRHDCAANMVSEQTAEQTVSMAAKRAGTPTQGKITSIKDFSARGGAMGNLSSASQDVKPDSSIRRRGCFSFACL